MKSTCIWVFSLLALCGCAGDGASAQKQSSNREREQKCIASSLDRNACMQFANQRCAGGFEVFEKDAAEADGVVRRGYYFKCLL